MIACMRWSLLRAGLCLAMALASTSAIACSCSSNVDPDNYLRAAALVFEGEVLPATLMNKLQNSVTLRVLEPLKGKLGDTVTLDQSRAGMCAPDFKPSERQRIAAYGNAKEGYATDVCSMFFMQPQDGDDEIYLRAVENRKRTLALSGSDKLPPNEALLRRLIRWLADYRSLEEGLEATDKLLNIAPDDREALLFKADFLSAQERDADALVIAQTLLVKNAADHEAERRYVLSLVRLNRSSEIPADWMDFSGLEAKGFDFRGRKVDGILLRDAYLFSADFSDTSMRAADFSGATITASDLSRAELSGADFSGARLGGSKFVGAKLGSANLDSVSSSSDFYGADLRGAVMTSAGFDGTNFSRCDLRGAVLAASYIDGDLSHADLSGADLRASTFGLSTYWFGAKLGKADLRGATINNGTIAQADLTDAIYDSKTVFPVGFDPVAAGAKRVDE